MNNPGDGRADEIERQAFALHDELRAGLRNALSLATRVERGDRHALEALAATAEELVDLVKRHLRFEEERLGPLIERVGSWGPARRELLADVERLQEEALSATAASVATVERPASLIAVTRRLARAVLRAIRIEERELLRPDAMQEEIVVSDQSTG